MALPTDSTFPAFCLLITFAHLASLPVALPPRLLPSNRRQPLTSPELSLHLQSLWWTGFFCTHPPHSIPSLYAFLPSCPTPDLPPAAAATAQSFHRFAMLTQRGGRGGGLKKKEGRGAGLKYAKSAGTRAATAAAAVTQARCQKLAQGHTQTLFKLSRAACKTDPATLPLWWQQMPVPWRKIIHCNG